MFRILIAALALGAFISPATAQEPSPEKIQKAQTAFELAMPDETLGDMGARTGRIMADQIGNALKAKGAALSESERDALIVRFTTAFVSEMKKLTPDVARIYASEMTDRELDLLVELYSDPEMAALMTKLPLVMEKMMPSIAMASRNIGSAVVGSMKSEGLLKDL